MLKSTDVRAWIASLGIAEDQHVYIGKLVNSSRSPLMCMVAAFRSAKYCF